MGQRLPAGRSLRALPGVRGRLLCAATAAPPPALAPARPRPRATLRDLFDSKGVVVSAYDTRLVMAIFSGNETEAVRVTEVAWDWCTAAGLSRRSIERLLRHFQHCNRYAAFSGFETVSQRNWTLFDRYLVACHAEQQQQGSTAARGSSALRAFANFADMLCHASQGLERVAEMLTVPPDELEAFLQVMSQRLSPAAAGYLVAYMPNADPLHLRPSAAMAESLVWMLETLPLGNGQGVSWQGLLAWAGPWTGSAGCCRRALQRCSSAWRSCARRRG